MASLTTNRARDAVVAWMEDWQPYSATDTALFGNSRLRNGEIRKRKAANAEGDEPASE